MLYLLKLLIIFGITTVNLSSNELKELKNNFYVNFDNSQVSSFKTNANEQPFVQSSYLYGVGYLRQFNNLYFGASLKFFSNDQLSYSVISENNKNVDIQKERDLILSLQARYNFFEFENIKMLVGVDLGYQLNNINLKYTASKLENIKEEQKREFSIGETIDKNFWKQCAFSGGNDNINWDKETEQGVVIGNGVYCTTYNNVEKEVEYSENTELMNSSIPISLNFTMLYGLTNNIDLGIGVGLTIVEELNINYTNNFINLNNKQSFSYYNLHFLINYKFGDKKK